VSSSVVREFTRLRNSRYYAAHNLIQIASQALEKQFPKLKRFPDLGRLIGVKAVMRDTTFQSSAFGKRENVETTINGRVIFDLLPYMFRNHKLSSYSLNSVSAEFLGECGVLCCVV
jgi:DNA polymerase elongation subunit (family B)